MRVTATPSLTACPSCCDRTCPRRSSWRTLRCAGPARKSRTTAPRAFTWNHRHQRGRKARSRGAGARVRSESIRSWLPRRGHQRPDVQAPDRRAEAVSDPRPPAAAVRRRPHAGHRLQLGTLDPGGAGEGLSRGRHRSVARRGNGGPARSAAPRRSQSIPRWQRPLPAVYGAVPSTSPIHTACCSTCLPPTSRRRSVRWAACCRPAACAKVQMPPRSASVVCTPGATGFPSCPRVPGALLPFRR